MRWNGNCEERKTPKAVEEWKRRRKECYDEGDKAELEEEEEDEQEDEEDEEDEEDDDDVEEVEIKRKKYQ